MTLPSAFCTRMERLLGEEYPRFRRAFEEDMPVRALQFNRGKAGEAAKKTLDTVGNLSAVPYEADGFFCTEGLTGNHPLHQAGAVYFQDPGAMSAVACLPPTLRGGRVLDLCAAPGGKSAGLAALTGEQGFLLSNEIIPSRCRMLCGNLERLGVRHAAVTNAEPAQIGAWFDRWFDVTVVDAPCSGEGMFRKSEEAVHEWSEARVRMCADRQWDILSSVYDTVRGGGLLLYSTCTFSTEENEEIVARFLQEHPDFSLADVSLAVQASTASGVTEGFCADMGKTRRFYPHVAPGEGQFMALFRRDEAVGTGTVRFACDQKKPSRQDMAVIEGFCRDALEAPLPHPVVLHGDQLVILPEQVLPPPFRCFAAGVALGEVTKGRLVPHHALFAAYGQLFARKLALTSEDSRTAAYLRGETVAAPDLSDGWAAVTVDGVPLGGGKVVAGVLKNHYPKGLRLH